jgi:hypothetical protein
MDDTNTFFWIRLHWHAFLPSYTPRKSPSPHQRKSCVGRRPVLLLHNSGLVALFSPFIAHTSYAYMRIHDRRNNICDPGLCIIILFIERQLTGYLDPGVIHPTSTTPRPQKNSTSIIQLDSKQFRRSPSRFTFCCFL